MQWETVIGLEVHVQLKTHSKIFSGAATRYGAPPNTQACAIDLGFPGVLPVLNKTAVEMACRFGLAIGATIAPHSIFARKNYFYPDLPKGYQISQYEHPIVSKGHLKITLEDGSQPTIAITRAHLEEDAGKSLHEGLDNMSGIDLNRAGIPLLEVVSEPDLRSAKAAVAYLKALHTLVQYLDICDGNLQEGSFRCDANVSVRHIGQPMGTRAEIKNVNSFRFVEKAIVYETERQIALLESGGTVIQETRLYDADTNTTRAMRTKEAAHDYRYFPDPDLLPVVLSAEFLASIKQTLPELPEAKSHRFITQYGLKASDAALLTSTRALADYYETVLTLTPSGTQHGIPSELAKLSANWIMGELSAALNQSHLDITHSPITPQTLRALLDRVLDQTLSGKMAKTVFESLWNQEGTVDQIIQNKGLVQIKDDSALLALIEQVITQNPGQVAEYRAGKDKLFGFFVGQLMKLSQGKANPDQVNALLKARLGQST
jgi:aspartyl-tRNA(Asn)/glutamyl-tRNA(Gln) amidotransferase subunit B